VGSAVIGAAEDAKGKLFELSAALLHAAPEDLETEDGKVYVSGKVRRRDPVEQGDGDHANVHRLRTIQTRLLGSELPHSFCRGGVDTDTGKVDLRRVVAATDAGQIIDPPSLEGQIYGSLGAAGMDTAVFEETIVDRRSGRMVNCNMIDYKWRTFSGTPGIPERHPRNRNSDAPLQGRGGWGDRHITRPQCRAHGRLQRGWQEVV
jgi:CO/xanthine dehydrogenase Mo-binding subunit